jgi:hypothetical protein
MAIKLPNWQDQIHDVAVQFMNAQVQFFVTNKNPVGAPVETILWQGKARVQQLRAPREGQTSYESTGSRMFRFQLDPDDNPPFFNEGTFARVLDGGRDPDLELLIMTVNSSINSSHRAVRTVELRADMNQVPVNRITGMVVDEVTEMPIGGVEVHVYNADNKLVQVVFTLPDGRFYSYPPKSVEYDLEFKKLPEYFQEVVGNIQIGDDVFVELTPDG